MTFEVEPSDGASLVRVTHVGFPTAEKAEHHSHGWTHYEERLRIVAEGGDPGEDMMDKEDAGA